MSEPDGHEPDDTAGETRSSAGGPAEAPRTGNPEVDAVLASTEGLAERPLGEHVEVFESAHDRLRAALADAGQQTSSVSPGQGSQPSDQPGHQPGGPQGVPHPRPVPRPGPR